jgi:hypothetical protein
MSSYRDSSFLAYLGTLLVAQMVLEHALVLTRVKSYVYLICR